MLRDTGTWHSHQLVFKPTGFASESELYLVRHGAESVFCTLNASIMLFTNLDVVNTVIQERYSMERLQQAISRRYVRLCSPFLADARR